MDHFDPARISVVMPCPNAAPYVGEAIASVRGQSYPQVGRIGVDDGSTEFMQRLAADHLERTLLFQNRDGPFAARSRALSRMHAALEIQPADYSLNHTR